MEDPEIPNCTWAVHAEDDGILEMGGGVPHEQTSLKVHYFSVCWKKKKELF